MIGSMPSAPAAAPDETLAGPAATAPRAAWRRAAALPALALLTSLLFCALLLVITGHNPLAVYGALWTGAVTGPAAFPETLVATTPYILLGLAVALGFKGGIFNIGAEGQFILGAIGATWAGHALAGAPAVVAALCALVVGAAAGALYAAIAGALKVFRGAHEVITTIMLNYVAAYLISWLVDQGGAMHGSSQIQQSYYVAAGAQLPILVAGTRLHAGLLIAVAGALVVYVLIWRTTWGFAVRAVGLNPMAALSAGISLRGVTLGVMATSGALAGLAGAIQITGLQHVLPDPFASGLGFDAIAVAIIGAGHPAGIILAALLMGALRNGATTMEISAGISAPFVSVIEASILFFVAAPVVVRWLYFRWGRRP
ncbi:MAG: ABC transporter permease [Chloroflexota bacterium]